MQFHPGGISDAGAFQSNDMAGPVKSTTDRDILLLYQYNILMGKDFQENAQSNAVYGLGMIGAAVFFISKAATFWVGVLGVLKALVWPAFLVYEAFKHLSV